MFEAVDSFVESLDLGISNLAKDLIVSGIITFIITASVLVIGALVNKLEQWQMQMIARKSGPKMAHFICNRLTFPGTIIHELSHALFVILTGAHLIKVKCFEVFKKGQLGHVEFGLVGGQCKQRMQMALISCAPVLIGLLLEYVIIRVNLTKDFEWYIHVLLWYLAISIADHMSMSSVDIKNYLRGLIFVFPMIMIVAIIIKYFFVVV